MEIIEFAIQMEKDGEKYYRELLQKSSSAGLQKIFALLADEEIRHRRLLENLHHQTAPVLEGSPILKNVKNIFLTMKNEKAADAKDAVTAFKKALDIEEMSRKFYLQKAEEVTDDKLRAILHFLAGEEENHVRIMENIVEFLSRPEPGSWLENAEWHHLDEY